MRKKNCTKETEEVDKKIRNTTNLVTNSVLNAKVIEIGNKILNSTGLVKKMIMMQELRILKIRQLKVLVYF